ncbi:MAG: TorF family putative porin [Pseudomonadota bacterium]
MKFPYKTILTASTLLASLPTVQATEFSANVALTSDYVFRGFTQTDEGWAIQGGFDINHSSGFSLGTWASNVKFLEDTTINPEDRADIEIDLYVGYGNELDNGFSYELKALQFIYPGAGSDFNYDFSEFHLGVGYSLKVGTKFGLSYDYSPEWFGETGKAHHYAFEIGHSLDNGLGFKASVGQQTFDENDKAGDDYVYYGASLSYGVAGFEFSLNFSDTDLDNVDDVADERLFFMLSKSF